MGTAAYMSPEQARGQTVDKRTDVYALGCVLYEMLTGRKPFAGGEYPALLFKHLNAEPPQPSAARPGIPVALDAVVARSMAKNPESRFDTAGEFPYYCVLHGGADGTGMAATLTVEAR